MNPPRSSDSAQVSSSLSRPLLLTGDPLLLDDVVRLGAAAGVAALGAVVHRWLPATPGLRTVLLAPPAAAAWDDSDPLADLIGAEGTTTTRLALAGKARVAGELRDVTSDGVLVEPGVAVRVVDVRGGRLVVRPVSTA